MKHWSIANAEENSRPKTFMSNLILREETASGNLAVIVTYEAVNEVGMEFKAWMLEHVVRSFLFFDRRESWERSMNFVFRADNFACGPGLLEWEWKLEQAWKICFSGLDWNSKIWVKKLPKFKDGFWKLNAKKQKLLKRWKFRTQKLNFNSMPQWR